jgi:hypothetical protein
MYVIRYRSIRIDAFSRGDVLEAMYALFATDSIERRTVDNGYNGKSK